jgi:flagellar hook-basal body complex protein FliE
MIQGLFAVSRITPETLSPAAGATPGAAPMAGPGSFAETLRAGLDQTVGTLQKAETMSIGAMRGEFETREVADAVMSAEQSLHAAIAIRDKIVQAYLEMSRMQI